MALLYIGLHPFNTRTLKYTPGNVKFTKPEHGVVIASWFGK